MNLKTLATFALGETKAGTAAKAFPSLNIAQGSVINFSVGSSAEKIGEASSPQDSSKRVGAIVNATNVRCIGGGGVDGAINNAGGPDLWKDRAALPIISKEGNRCHIGGAVVTGPGRYGRLSVNYVVHAVGPAYPANSIEDDDDDDDDDSSNENASNDDEDFSVPDALLRSAYQEALDRCRENGITDVAFSLLSAGIYRGKRSLEDVLSIAVLAIRDWVIEQEKTDSASSAEGDDDDDDENNPTTSTKNQIQSITLCGFSKIEVDTLTKVCRFVF